MRSCEEQAKLLDEVLGERTFDILLPKGAPVDMNYIAIQSCAEAASRCPDAPWALTVTAQDFTQEEWKGGRAKRDIITDRNFKSYAAMCRFAGLAMGKHVVALRSDAISEAQAKALEGEIEILYDGAGLFSDQDVLAPLGGFIASDRFAPTLMSSLPAEVEARYDDLIKKVSWNSEKLLFENRFECAFDTPERWREFEDVISLGHLKGDIPPSFAHMRWPFSDFFSFYGENTAWGKAYKDYFHEVLSLLSLWDAALSDAGCRLNLHFATYERRRNLMEIAAGLGIGEVIESRFDETRQKDKEAFENAVASTIRPRSHWEDDDVYGNLGGQSPKKEEESSYTAFHMPRIPLIAAPRNPWFRQYGSADEMFKALNISSRENRLGLIVIPERFCFNTKAQSDADKLLAALAAYDLLPDDLAGLICCLPEDIAAPASSIESRNFAFDVLYDEDGASGRQVGYGELFSTREQGSMASYPHSLEVELHAPFPKKTKEALRPWAEKRLCSKIGENFIRSASIGECYTTDAPKMIERLSYGHFALPDVVSDADLNITWTLQVRPLDIVDDAEAWERRYQTVLDIASIWSERLRASALTSNGYSRRGDVDTFLANLQEMGRILGIDSDIELYFEDGVSVEHILGYAPHQFAFRL